VAWIDADVEVQPSDWAQETLQLLQHYDVLQMFKPRRRMWGRTTSRLKYDSGDFLYKWVTDRPSPHERAFMAQKASVWILQRA